MNYRKKPVVIEAVQWTGLNLKEIEEFAKNSKSAVQYSEEKGLLILTLEGMMEASVGDYIIKGVGSELYPCKPDIFLKTYEIAGGMTTKQMLADISYLILNEMDDLRNKDLWKSYLEEIREDLDMSDFLAKQLKDSGYTYMCMPPMYKIESDYLNQDEFNKFENWQNKKKGGR